MPFRPHRRGAAANPVHALRVRRLPSLCRGAGGRIVRHQPLPARRRTCNRRAGRADRTRGKAARSGMRRAHTIARGGHRRGRVHRLHAVHRRLPGRCDPRRAEADARRAAVAMLGMRAVCRTLPGRLHRHAASRPGVERRRCRCRQVTPRRTNLSPGAQRTHCCAYGNGRPRGGRRRCTPAGGGRGGARPGACTAGTGTPVKP